MFPNVNIPTQSTNNKMSQPRSGMATATSFHFRGVTSALDEDSDDEICYQDQDFADVPQKAQKTTNQQSTKRMSMTSDLNSTPNGGREWRRSSHSSTAMVIGDNDNDEIQYTPLDNGRGPQPKLSLTERILVRSIANASAEHLMKLIKQLINRHHLTEHLTRRLNFRTLLFT